MHHLQYAALSYVGYEMYALFRLPNDPNSQFEIDGEIRPNDDDSNFDCNWSVSVAPPTPISVDVNSVVKVVVESVGSKMVAETDPGGNVETSQIDEAETSQSIKKPQKNEGMLVTEMACCSFVAEDRVEPNCENTDHIQLQKDRLISLVNRKAYPTIRCPARLDMCSTAVFEFERQMIENESKMPSGCDQSERCDETDHVVVDEPIESGPEPQYIDELTRPPSPASWFMDLDNPSGSGYASDDQSDIVNEIEYVCSVDEENREEQSGKIYLVPSLDTTTSPSATSKDCGDALAQLVLSSRTVPTATIGECSSLIRPIGHMERTHREQLPVTDEMEAPVLKKLLRRPKRTKNPFFAFKNANWWHVRAEMPQMQDKYQIVRELGRRWREMSEEAKQMYRTAACVKMRRACREIPAGLGDRNVSSDPSANQAPMM